MKSKKGDFGQIEKIYSDPQAFKARALEEIKRSKRYATFVSMVSVDLSHIDNVDEIENFASFDEFMTSVRTLVKNSIRETDLVSDSNRHKVLLLLMDTSKEGALALAQRLKKTLRYFICGNIRSPINWRVPIKEYSFPSGTGDDFNIQSFLDKIDGE